MTFIIFTLFLCLIQLFNRLIIYPRFLASFQKFGIRCSFLSTEWSFRIVLSPLRHSRSLKIAKVWFLLGLIVFFLLMALSVIVFTMKIIKNVFDSSTEGSLAEPVEVRLAVPGLNLPVDDLFIYLLVILISSAFHELGHATAAFINNITSMRIGLGLLLIMPTAFVQLPSNQISLLNSCDQLSIYAAGIWNNVFLAGLSLSLRKSLPIFLNSLYEKEYLRVSYIDESSPIFDPIAGLGQWDVLMAINDCQLENLESWKNCLTIISKTEQQGFCLKASLLRDINAKEDASGRKLTLRECCVEHKAPSKFCFIREKDEKQKFLCLTARKVIESRRKFGGSAGLCEENEEYLKPYTVDSDHRLFVIQRRNKKDFLFIGNLKDIMTIEVTDLKPKFSWLPWSLPRSLARTLDYFVMISSALALINCFPCFFFDGEYFTEIVIRQLFTGVWTETKIRMVKNSVLSGGTALIVAVLVIELRPLV